MIVLTGQTMMSTFLFLPDSRWPARYEAFVLPHSTRAWCALGIALGFL